MSLLVAALGESGDGTWLLWVLLGVCFYLFGVPLLIWRTFKAQADPTLEPIDPVATPLPPAAQQYFDRVEPEFVQAGFAPVATLFLPSAVSNVKSLLRLYVNRPEKEVAIAMCAFAAANESAPVQTNSFVEYCTRCADGREFNTGNSEQIGAFPRRANVSTTHFPWIKSPWQLHMIHRAVVAREAPGATKVLKLDKEFEGDVPSYLASAMREEMSGAAEFGYLYLVPDGTEFRATLKGAYLMTWKQLPPMKQVLETLRRKKAQRLLEGLGMGVSE